MMFQISDLLLRIGQAFLFVFFFFRCMQQNLQIPKKWVCLATILYIATSVIAVYFLPHSRYVSMFIALLFCGILFDGTLRAKTIWIITALLINGISDYFVMNVSVLFPNINYSTTDTLGWERILATLGSKLVQLLCFYLSTHHFQKNPYMEWNVCLPLYIVAIGCWILLEILFSYSALVINPIAHVNLHILAGLGMLSIVVSIITLYNRLTLQKNENVKIGIQLNAIQLTHAHIAQMKDLYSRLSNVQHDLKNHFAAIQGYLQEGEYDAIGSYIASLNTIEKGRPIFVEHPVLDAVIGMTYSTLKDKDTCFKVQVALPPKVPISDVDLSILFGCLLDNAVEGIAAVPKGTETLIELKTKISDDYWVVVCRNTTDEGTFQMLHSIPTTKKDEGVHGIGTRQINDIARRTGGYVLFQKANHLFSAIVMLKMPAPGKEGASHG